jgi:hypothetical protein
MKITGPKPPLTPPPADLEPGKVDGKSPLKGPSGPAFSEALAGPGKTQDAGAVGAADAAVAGPGRAEASRLAQELRAGSLTPEQAVEAMIDKVVAARVPAGAPEAVREQVREALRDAMASDPMLVERLKRLGELR